MHWSTKETVASFSKNKFIKFLMNTYLIFNKSRKQSMKFCQALKDPV